MDGKLAIAKKRHENTGLHSEAINKEENSTWLMRGKCPP
jgi:hypothetical protein